MKKKLKIGWQKYEDLIEKQMSSPLIHTLMENIMSQFINSLPTDHVEGEEDEQTSQINNLIPPPMMIPMSQQLIEDISMLSNFDCWIGHTNFDITHRIKEKLNEIDGVEILKICSRYRFFIGIGKMFNFSDVRKNIENELINKEAKLYDRGQN
ncbi:hypothetical protein EBZ38_10725 [bacterium]|nr:hypothetical protein [bacterium]